MQGARVMASFILHAKSTEAYLHQLVNPFRFRIHGSFIVTDIVIQVYITCSSRPFLRIQSYVRKAVELFLFFKIKPLVRSFTGNLLLS